MSDDGTRLVAVTENNGETHVVVLDTADGAVQWRQPIRDDDFPVRAHFVSPDADLVLVQTFGLTQLIQRDKGVIQSIPSRSGTYKPGTSRSFIQVSHRSNERYDQQGNLVSNTTRSFYALRDRRFVKLYSETRPSSAWEGLGTAISSEGWIAIQNVDHYTLISPEAESSEVPWPSSDGQIYDFDPASKQLLMTRGNQLFTIDRSSAEKTGRIDLPNGTYWRMAVFLNRNQLLLTSRDDDSVSDSLLRANLHNGTIRSFDIGGLTKDEHRRRLKAFGVATCLWLAVLLMFTWLANGACISFGALFVVTTVGIAYVNGCPVTSALYSDWILSSSGFIAFLGLTAMACLCGCLCLRSEARLIPQLSCLLCAASVIGIASSYVFEVTTAFWIHAAPAIAVISASRPLIGRLHELRGRRTSNASRRIQFRLADLLWLSVGIASALASLSFMERFHGGWEETTWNLLSGITIAAMCYHSVWLFDGFLRWWIRLPVAILLSVVGLYLLSFTPQIRLGYFNRIAGTEAAILLASVWIALLYLLGLSRGISPDGNRNRP